MIFDLLSPILLQSMVAFYITSPILNKNVSGNICDITVLNSASPANGRNGTSISHAL